MGVITLTRDIIDILSSVADQDASKRTDPVSQRDFLSYLIPNQDDGAVLKGILQRQNPQTGTVELKDDREHHVVHGILTGLSEYVGSEFGPPLTPVNAKLNGSGLFGNFKDLPSINAEDLRHKKSTTQALGNHLQALKAMAQANHLYMQGHPEKALRRLADGRRALRNAINLLEEGASSSQKIHQIKKLLEEKGLKVLDNLRFRMNGHHPHPFLGEQLNLVQDYIEDLLMMAHELDIAGWTLNKSLRLAALQTLQSTSTIIHQYGILHQRDIPPSAGDTGSLDQTLDQLYFKEAIVVNMLTSQLTLQQRLSMAFTYKTRAYELWDAAQPNPSVLDTADSFKAYQELVKAEHYLRLAITLIDYQETFIPDPNIHLAAISRKWHERLQEIQQVIHHPEFISIEIQPSLLQESTKRKTHKPMATVIDIAAFLVNSGIQWKFHDISTPGLDGEDDTFSYVLTFNHDRSLDIFAIPHDLLNTDNQIRAQETLESILQNIGPYFEKYAFDSVAKINFYALDKHWDIRWTGQEGSLKISANVHTMDTVEVPYVSNPDRPGADSRPTAFNPPLHDFEREPEPPTTEGGSTLEMAENPPLALPEIPQADQVTIQKDPASPPNIILSPETRLLLREALDLLIAHDRTRAAGFVREFLKAPTAEISGQLFEDPSALTLELIVKIACEASHEENLAVNSTDKSQSPWGHLPTMRRAMQATYFRR